METTAFRVIDRGADLDVLGATHLVECTTLAIGCEGVEFGVPGARLALVQVYTPDTCFVFDIVDLQPEEAPTPALELLKSLLESSSIVKVAHDSKWHGLLLKQRCGILLSTVHDTASWHAVLRGMGDTLHATGLNETLHAYGCTTVPPRDTAGYTANPSFWETRPLTSQMKLRALQPVKVLLALQAAQLRAATPAQVPRCHDESAANVARLREGTWDVVYIHPTQLRRLDAKKLRALEAKTSSFVATRAGPPPIAFVHAHSDSALAAGVEALQKYTDPASPRLAPFDEMEIEPDEYGPREYGFGDFDYDNRGADYDEFWYYRYGGEGGEV